MQDGLDFLAVLNSLHHSLLVLLWLFIFFSSRLCFSSVEHIKVQKVDVSLFLPYLLLYSDLIDKFPLAWTL